ncbi:MAG: FAD-dependent thymidylate synthase [Patescibacteria group bacterium]|jgi:thymidylate synthase ThyX
MSNVRRIYTLSHELMPEVRAVTFAKCSRSPESFDEIAKELTEAKSAEFHEKWVVGYGHSSVAEHAFLSIAMENVSIIATKIIEDCRLASFTEKSTRYQIFTRDRCYYPENIMNSEFADLYKNTINLLFDTYEKIMGPLGEFIKNKYPPTPEQGEKIYASVCKSRTCDNARYLLPAGTLTNLGMTVNARTLEHLIVKLLSHPLQEMNNIGEDIKNAGIAEVPTLIKFADINEYQKATGKSLKNIASEIFNRKQIQPTEEPVNIVDYDTDAENKLIAALLYRFSDIPYQQIIEQVKQMTTNQKEKIIDEALNRRATFDAPLREFEHIYYTFDILMDYGAFRDVQRHRMCTQTNQLVTAVHGYETPDEIVEAGFGDDYKKAMDAAADAYQKISTKFPFEAGYLVPLAFRHRTLFTWNLRELHHFISLRSGKKGHASYRRIAQLCWQKLNSVQPLLAKYIRVDMDQTGISWAATMDRKDFVFNPYAARQNNEKKSE